MYTGHLGFAQIMGYLPMRRFATGVGRYNNNRKIRTFSCRDQFLAMAVAQLTYRESLRDIVTCLAPLQSKLYHMGICAKLSRSTLADANSLRDTLLDLQGNIPRFVHVNGGKTTDNLVLCPRDKVEL